MRTVILIATAALVGALAACSNKAESAANTTEDAKCIEPSNPWAGDGGGHEAGFNWAEENRYECPSDHGESFEEGCVEYHNQLSRYEACEAAKRRK